ncbi:OmpA/MotB family protein [Govanella unica]|uniref:OmpA family protein n=1 Tax=Govanella unica TaxID=2975056 RepID=A0A9X3TX02_9PROT|nr:flagellar motor protein MotB [Govania unica]MDA5193225.1 OmpA family protein [Govania unica]
MNLDQHPLDDLAPPKSQAWLLTFADLLSLILCFFILQFSMNAVEDRAWRVVVDSLSDRLNPAAAKLRLHPNDSHDDSQIEQTEAGSIEYLATLFAEKMSRDPLLSGGRVRLLEDRVAISIPADLLFRAQSATVGDPAVYAALGEIASALDRLDNEVSVVGYTDPSSVDAKLYASEWELSLDRALTIARILRHSGYRQPVASYAYGERRFGDLLDDLPPAIQSRLSRRVDIVIRRDEVAQRLE